MGKIEKDGYRLEIDDENKLLKSIGFTSEEGYRKIFSSEAEFVSSVAVCNGGEVRYEENGDVRIIFRGEYFDAESLISVSETGIQRRQSYLIKKQFTGFINPRFFVCGTGLSYTYPLRVYDAPLESVGELRNDYLWALPLPAHIFGNGRFVGAYFIDKESAVGTADVKPCGNRTAMGFYYPDCALQAEVILPFSDTNRPTECILQKGERIVFKERFAFSSLKEGENALLQGEKLIAKVLLSKQPQSPNLKSVAKGIAEYYLHNELYDENAFGTGKGWYRNMWKHTHGGTPEKDFYYDLGWGEGYGVCTLSALVRYSFNTGSGAFDERIRSITENMDVFLRDQSVKGAYYDRIVPEGMPSLLGKSADGKGCDFLGIKRIWTHSLGMIGYQLACLYEETPDYDRTLREKWICVAREIADFLLKKQKENGDINDGFDERDDECNKKLHRIPARAIVCGLFAALYRITKEEKYLHAACRLAEATSPEIEAYRFYNQMLDAHVDVVDGEIVESGGDTLSEVYDAENACYAFVGLVELYGETKDKKTLALCERCAAYFISWMYFYDIKTGANGCSRGATTCRMPDFPLCYIGAGNFASPALEKLSRLTGDGFYKEIAREMLVCAAKYQWNDPHVPWHGAVVHAVYQVNGKHWGPNIEGQMDTGMTSGTTLMNIEKLLGRRNVE